MSAQHEAIVNDTVAYLIGRCAEAGIQPDEEGRRRIAHLLAMVAMRAAEDVGDDGPTFLRQVAEAHTLTVRMMVGSKGRA